MLTKWRQAIKKRYAQLDVELLQAMGTLGVGKIKGDEKTPPIKVVSIATQLCLFPCVIECNSSFFVPQDVKQRAPKKKRVKKDKKDNNLVEESTLRVGLPLRFPSTNSELTPARCEPRNHAPGPPGLRDKISKRRGSRGVRAPAAYLPHPSTAWRKPDKARRVPSRCPYSNRTPNTCQFQV